MSAEKYQKAVDKALLLLARPDIKDWEIKPLEELLEVSCEYYEHNVGKKPKIEPKEYSSLRQWEHDLFKLEYPLRAKILKLEP